MLPNVGNIALTEASATMDYHSLQTTGRRRFSAGVEFLAAYTFGKTLTDNLGYYGGGFTAGEGAYWQNAYDRRGNRGPAFFDVTHNFTIGGLWDLPYGRGKKFGSSASKPVDLIFGGWNVNYFVIARTGFPITIMATDRTGQAARGNVRANRYGPLKPDPALVNVDNYYGLPVDTAARTAYFCTAGVFNGICPYGQPADGSFGNSGIGTERGPSFFSTDFSVGKKFYVTERQYLDFRAEFFNLFNHASWGAPGRSIASPAAFGAVTSQVQDPRNIQFGLKYYF